MVRYQRDPDRRRVADLIRAEVNRAREAQREGDWITYLIRDPRKPDKRGNPAGTPIYVGQTKEFATRVQSRFDKCEKEATAKDSIARRMSDLLHAGYVGRYEVLDRTKTRLSSLISETNWARLCVERGYDTANLLPEQRIAAPPITRMEMPPGWIWPFLVTEAEQDDIGLSLNCHGCALRVPIPLETFQNLQRPPISLFEIRTDPMWRTEPCTQCGQRQTRKISLIL